MVFSVCNIDASKTHFSITCIKGKQLLGMGRLKDIPQLLPAYGDGGLDYYLNHLINTLAHGARGKTFG